jgi:hypothetical protein
MSNKRYSLGYILDIDGNRLETKPDDVNHLVQFLLESNFITNIDITYVTINFSLDTDQQIYNKLASDTIYIWITAVEDEKVLRLWKSFFRYKYLSGELQNEPIFRENYNKFLISVLDEQRTLKEFFNILHINNISDIIINQYSNLVWNKISLFEDQSYTTVYVFYDNEHTYHKDLFNTNITTLDTQNEKTFIYCNVNNFIEFSQIISQIQTNTNSQQITSNNTLFIYFLNKLEVYFQVYAIVEDPITIFDINVSSNVRHFPYYQSYATTNYVDISQLMVQYLVPKFIENPTIAEISNYFKEYLRCFIIGPTLTKYQYDRYNYLNYTYYVRAPVDINFLVSHRITIYSVMLEKALKIAKNILYRDINNLDLLYNSSLYLDGKSYGLINQAIVGNNIDFSYFNRLIYLTYNLKDLYYITEPVVKQIKVNDVFGPSKKAISPFMYINNEKLLLENKTTIITNIKNPDLEQSINYALLTGATTDYTGFDQDNTTVNKFSSDDTYKTEYIYSIYNFQTI